MLMSLNLTFGFKSSDVTKLRIYTREPRTKRERERERERETERQRDRERDRDGHREIDR